MVAECGALALGSVNKDLIWWAGNVLADQIAQIRARGICRTGLLTLTMSRERASTRLKGACSLPGQTIAFVGSSGVGRARSSTR